MITIIRSIGPLYNDNNCWLQDAEAAAQDDVERVLKVTAEYKQRWNQAWEEQEKRLKQNLQICQFNYDLRQVP